MKYAVTIISAILLLTGVAYIIHEDQTVILVGLLSIPAVMASLPWQLLADQQAAEHEEEMQAQRLLDQIESQNHMVQPIGFTADVKSSPEKESDPRA